MECKREKIATINKHINISYGTNSCWGGGTTKQVGTLLQSEQARLVGGTAGQEQRDGEDGSAHYQHHLKKPCKFMHKMHEIL